MTPPLYSLIIKSLELIINLTFLQTNKYIYVLDSVLPGAQEYSSG